MRFKTLTDINQWFFDEMIQLEREFKKDLIGSNRFTKLSLFLIRRRDEYAKQLAEGDNLKEHY